MQINYTVQEVLDLCNKELTNTRGLYKDEQTRLDNIADKEQAEKEAFEKELQEQKDKFNEWLDGRSIDEALESYIDKVSLGKDWWFSEEKFEYSFDAERLEAELDGFTVFNKNTFFTYMDAKNIPYSCRLVDESIYKGEYHWAILIASNLYQKYNILSDGGTYFTDYYRSVNQYSRQLITLETLHKSLTKLPKEKIITLTDDDLKLLRVV